MPAPNASETGRRPQIGATGGKDRIHQQRERDRREDREEWAQARRAMNKQWSELAAKMGTVVEDIVAPSVRRMARELFDCGEQLLFTSRIDRVRSDDRSRRREFDVLTSATGRCC